jgi:tRNA G18 (ribose-2'-O)-methylase SpoU
MIHLTGYTPYPALKNDLRLPHLSKSQTTKIAKTALGAEKSMPITHSPDIIDVIENLKHNGYEIIGLEQHSSSEKINNYIFPPKVALVLGEERYGISSEVLNQCDTLVEIPMMGLKESFNVSVATGIALYAINVAQHTQHHITR